MPPLPEASVGPFLDRVGGLRLSGGPDLDPGAYGATPHARLGPTEGALRRLRAGVHAADQRGLPVLAICRGAQVVNVARGGALHQHLPDVVGEAVHHRQTAAASEPTHPVTVAPGSRLARSSAAGGPTSILPPPGGLAHGRRAVPTAWATDGTVEAFEAAGVRFSSAAVARGVPRRLAGTAPLHGAGRRRGRRQALGQAPAASARRA